jgi:hypothetical protein
MISEKLAHLEVTLDAAAVMPVRDLQRQIDRIVFLQSCASLFASPLSLAEIITRLMDDLWQRNQFTYAALLLGESELGPYHYQDLRGVVDARRYLKKVCPLPLWGELAHALVRRLDPEEPDYLLIDNIATTGRPTPDEFPWMPRSGTLIILPLRKNTVAIGALALGRTRVDLFADLELRWELVEFAAMMARAVIGAQIQEELHARAEQLAGLQLFSRSIATSMSFIGLLTNIIEGISELMRAASVLLAFDRTAIPPQLLQLLQQTPGMRIYQNLIGISTVTFDEPMALFAHLYRLLMWSIDASQPLFLDPAMSVDSIEDLYYNETGRALIAPITIGESPLGVLYIEAPVTALWVRRGRYGRTAHCY